MFKKAKVGDKVFSYTLQEWGTIIDTKHSNLHSDKYPIEVQFEYKTITYTYKGKELDKHKVPTLFWDEVAPIIPPKKPLPKLEIDTKVNVWSNNLLDLKYRRHFKRFTEAGGIVCFDSGADSWSSAGGEVLWDNWELADEN